MCFHCAPGPVEREWTLDTLLCVVMQMTNVCSRHVPVMFGKTLYGPPLSLTSLIIPGCRASFCFFFVTLLDMQICTYADMQTFSPTMHHLQLRSSPASCRRCFGRLHLPPASRTLVRLASFAERASGGCT